MRYLPISLVDLLLVETPGIGVLGLAIVVVVVVRHEVQLDRIQGNDHEIRPAFLTTELITAVDIELVDVDSRVAFHAISYRPLRGRFDEGPSKGPAVS